MRKLKRYIRQEPEGGLKWITVQTLKREKPNVGFGNKIRDQDFKQFGNADPVWQEDYPEITPTQVIEDDTFPVFQTYTWPVPEEPEGGWIDVEGNPTDPPAPAQKDLWLLGFTVREKTQEELLAEVPWKDYTSARKAVVAWIDNLTSQIESLYPSSVQKRWLIEEAAARAVAADDGSATQDQIDMMTNEGAAKGRTPQEHAAAVIQNADRFRAIADETNKLFLATDAQLQAAASPLEYAGIFEWAQAQAAPLAAAYGLSVE